jgi:hypothetical protein
MKMLWNQCVVDCSPTKDMVMEQAQIGSIVKSPSTGVEGLVFLGNISRVNISSVGNFLSLRTACSGATCWKVYSPSPACLVTKYKPSMNFSSDVYQHLADLHHLNR